MNMNKNTFRNLALIAALIIYISACSAQGCQGCQTESIPGGFPSAQKFENAVQVRLSQSGLEFIETNFSKIVEILIPTGLTFTIPPSGCGTSQEICCDGSLCSATLEITSVDITPSAPNHINLSIHSKVQTTKIKFTQKVGFISLACKVEYNSTKVAPDALGLDSEITLQINPTNKTLQIVRSSTSISDFQNGDLDITGSGIGGLVCTLADWLKSLFKGTIENGVESAIASTVDQMLATLPTGQEGRFDLASFMEDFLPYSSGTMDYHLFAGGYASSEDSGVSVGAIGGFRSPVHNSCVPDCTLPNADCIAPSPNISRSQTFSGNLRPDGKSYHVGIGIHKQSLDAAAYGLYSSGALCLNVGATTISQLTSSLFGFLIPSLTTLTHGKNVPVLITTRPKQPPEIILGAGTSHKDNQGNLIIDDPLLTISAKEFSFDIYALLEQRYVRLFTVVSDISIPTLLFADANGNLQPVVGDLTKAMSNVQVQNNDLITEDPQSLTQIFPLLLGIAATTMGSNFEPIQLPSFEGVQLILDDQSIVSVDSNQILAIFANLGLMQNMSAPWIETKASIENIDIPPSRYFAVGPNFLPNGGPAVTIKVSSEIPQQFTRSNKPIEWSYRIDNGFYRTWSTEKTKTIQDPLFWLPGKHTIDVISRIQSEPLTTDPTPYRINVTIDSFDTMQTETVSTGCNINGAYSHLGILLSILLLGFLITRWGYVFWGQPKK